MRIESDLIAAVVENAISTRTDKVDIDLCSKDELQLLTTRAWVDGTNALRATAFLEYFKRYEAAPCPEPIQVASNTLRAGPIEWKWADGFIQHNQAFSDLRVIFIRRDAQMHSWFHELAHIVFDRINEHMLKKLVDEARYLYLPVIDPPGKPEGEYLAVTGTLNGAAFLGYCGLDHHGDEGIDNEIWASLFGLYGYGVELDPPITGILEKVIEALANQP